MSSQDHAARSRCLHITSALIGILSWAATAERAATQTTTSARYVPPPGTAIATGTKVEQDGDLRAGTPGVGGSVTTPLDWANASGGRARRC